jgi:hypothetical protein
MQAGAFLDGLSFSAREGGAASLVYGVVLRSALVIIEFDTSIQVPDHVLAVCNGVAGG